MRITLMIDNLGAGGAERVMSTMANYWAERGWDVTLITTNDPSVVHFFRLHPRVEHRNCHVENDMPTVWHRLRNVVRRCTVLRAAIRETRPDVVISFLDVLNVRVLVATLGLRLPIIVSERSNPYQYPIRRSFELLRHCLYPRAAAVVMQTARSIDYFSPGVRARCRVIPNPITVPPVSRQLRSTADGEHIVIAVGRLVEVKQFDRLIQAFAAISAEHPNWRMEIWGDGPDRQRLEALVRESGVADKVNLAGTTSEPYRQLARADLFILTSRVEGFPNALLEAMACGLPVISVDCPFGPREIIHDGIDGVLVPPDDIDALAAAMSRLMCDAGERRRLAARAVAVRDDYAVERVMAMWETLIHNVIRNRRVSNAVVSIPRRARR